MSHTKEPWTGKVDGKYNSNHSWYFDNESSSVATAAPIWAGGKPVAFAVATGHNLDELVANASRIVACVNACAGISDDELANGVMPKSFSARVVIPRITNERDEMLAALKDLHKAYRRAVGLHSGQDDAYTVRSHNAIAKAEQS